MYKIAQEQIQKEIRGAKCVAIISDDKTDVSSFMQNVVVLRYVVSGKIEEKFDLLPIYLKGMLRRYQQTCLIA